MENMLLKTLECRFGVSEKKLYPYLLFRKAILDINLKPISINNTELAYFIVKQLSLPILIDGKIKYDGKVYCINLEIVDFVDALKERHERSTMLSTIEAQDEMKNQFNRIVKHANAMQFNLPREKKVKEWYFIQAGLSMLNAEFDAVVKAPKIIDKLSYEGEYIPFYETEEENIATLIRNYEASTTNIKYLSEAELEKYLIGNLDKIEEDLQLITSQMSLPAGRIDILAKDKDDNIVVIELKVKEDKDILWQSLYYVDEIEKRYGKSKVRMMVIAPKMSNSLKDILRNISKAEIYQFTPLISHRKLVDIKIYEQ